MRLRASILSFLLACAQPALAQQETIPQPASTPTATVGRNLFAVSASYGKATQINASVDTDIAGAWLRWTRMTKGHFLGAQPAYGFEVAPFLVVDQNPRAHGIVGHFVYEQRWLPQRSFRPVLRAGVGMMYTERRVPVGETHYNFSLFAGMGVEAALGARTALSLEYRLHHLSNANTGNRNLGINAHTILIGVIRRY